MAIFLKAGDLFILPISSPKELRIKRKIKRSEAQAVRPAIGAAMKALVSGAIVIKNPTAIGVVKP